MLEECELCSNKKGRKNKSTIKVLKSYEKVKKNGEDKYSLYEQQPFSERKVTEFRISEGVELLEQGKIKSIEELAKILVDRRPLNVAFQEVQRAQIDEWNKDKEIDEWNTYKR